MEYAVRIVVWIFMAFFWMRIFEKSQKAKILAFLPVGDEYIRFSIAGKTGWFYPYLVLSCLAEFVRFLYQTLNGIDISQSDLEGVDLSTDVFGLLLIFLLLEAFVIFIRIYRGIHIARRFGKSRIFGIFLGILPIFTVPVLALDGSEDQGNKV